jgi:hypothetical protein
METLMRRFGRKNGTPPGHNSTTGRSVVHDTENKDRGKPTYASQELLKRSVVKAVEQHRPALEWLADK